MGAQVSQGTRQLGRGRPCKRRLSPGTVQIAKGSWRPRLLIREVRMARELSQADLAKLLGIEPSRVSAWERGYITPSWGALNHIAKALGCHELRELIDPSSRFGQDNLPFHQSTL